LGAIIAKFLIFPHTSSSSPGPATLFSGQRKAEIRSIFADFRIRVCGWRMASAASLPPAG
jgi:hypothetical protein